MITSTSCASCPQLNDAYELGITHYTGSAAEENGTLDDNLTGYYQFVPAAKAQVVPFGNGYYIEYKTKNTGEYWISKNNIAPANTNLCPGGGFLLNSTAGAAVYQWQVNTGSGYTNISDGANYSGSSTATLQLSNLLTSFTGYKYRCAADGVNGTEYTLRFKNTWTGASSTNWFTASNWSCGAVPDINTDVIIPSGLATYPVLTASTAIRSLRVLTNVPLLINASVKLDITGK
jgi:hypothetical protein